LHHARANIFAPLPAIVVSDPFRRIVIPPNWMQNSANIGRLTLKNQLVRQSSSPAVCARAPIPRREDPATAQGQRRQAATTVFLMHDETSRRQIEGQRFRMLTSIVNSPLSAAQAGLNWAMIEVMAALSRYKKKERNDATPSRNNVAILAEEFETEGLSRMPWPFCDVELI